MSEQESSDYARWVELANDPSQSEEDRRHYRLQMEGYLHKKVREAFQFAAGGRQYTSGTNMEAGTACRE